MSTLDKLKNAAIKAERQRDEFAPKRNLPFTTPTAPASSNSSWRSRAPTTTSATPATTQARTFDRSQGITPMEVDANAFVCFNCYEEGHAAAQCKNEKQPRREIIRRPKPQRVAATEVAAPAKAERVSEKKEGKKREFKQGSSKDGAHEPSPEVIAIRAEMSDLKLQFARLTNILTNNNPRDESDF
ncbi:hypothetical protein FIBSPDRAFT_955826 [Athelia psychrophila]|uniref:CCHC-type domain-containing protein n=1 Tax=Athelia psychrophila TaxID=1759441 RepID=A0A166HP86_9AGAM|nr:hypothetical protein FIBSPDRAFT_955826 [Fibularhizoctonia sp. CBS 109695]